MSPEEMMLNLVCLDKGIIQLSDLESVEKQFSALSPAEKRKVSRKIRKLAKKFIARDSSYPEVCEQKKLIAGLSEKSSHGHYQREKYKKVKINFARRYLMDIIYLENIGTRKEQ